LIFLIDSNRRADCRWLSISNQGQKSFVTRI
jgi:hypothetical protein